MTNKPIIETMINTAALAMTSAGVLMACNRDYYGFILVAFGALLEFFKYKGRQVKLW